MVRIAVDRIADEQVNTNTNHKGGEDGMLLALLWQVHVLSVKIKRAALAYNEKFL